jgi:hypothetical protein
VNTIITCKKSGTNGGQSALTTAPAGYSTFQIILDTTSVNWTYTFIFNGITDNQRSLGRTGTINYVDFGDNGTSMNMGNLSR